jgi:hypothetical protein
MNAGVEIILERIKTHPEEFCNKGGGKIVNGKWSRVLENYGGHLEQEDIDAINNAIDKVQQDYFTEEVMTILTDGRDSASDEGKFNPYLAPSATRLVGTTLGAYSNTAPITTGTWGASSIEQTLARLEEIKKEYDKPKPKRWWNKTIPELLGKK